MKSVEKEMARRVVTLSSLILITYAATFGVVLPYVCKDWVYSCYFDPRDGNSWKTAKRAVDLNARRLDDAEEYLNDVFTSTSRKSSASRLPTPYFPPNVDVVVGIITSKRPVEEKLGYSLGYMTQTAASFHKAMSRENYMGNKKLFVCNVDAEPSLYDEALSLQSTLRQVVRYVNYSSIYTRPEEKFQKEKDDYLYCLQQALLYKPGYVLLVEDDVILYPGFFHVLHYALYSRIITRRDVMPFGQLKSYYPSKWQGYSFEISKLLELCGIFILGGSLSIFMFMTPCLRHASISRRLRGEMLLYGMAGGVYATVVAFTIGRQYVIEYLSVSPYLRRVIPSPSCCTQAVLYPYSVALELSRQLGAVDCNIDYSIDHAVNDFMLYSGYSSYLIEPNLVNHIGMYSSLRRYGKQAAEFLF